jgi:nicotinamide mononucleotide transporter
MKRGRQSFVDLLRVFQDFIVSQGLPIGLIVRRYNFVMDVRKLNVLHLAVVSLVSIVVGLILRQIYKGDWFEFAAFVTGVVGVYLVAVEHIFNWPVGLVNVTIYGYVFFTSRLYADMSLQVFFFVLGVMGWLMWAKGGENQSELKITSIPLAWWLGVGISLAVGTAIYYPIIKHFNGAAPFLDSLLTVGSIIDQLLLNAKKIENWILWIAVDIVYIPLYISRSLYSTAVLYALLLGLAVAGFIGWNKSLRSLAASRDPLSNYPRKS